MFVYKLSGKQTDFMSRATATPTIARAPSEDSYQPVHLHRLISVSAVRLKTLWTLGYPHGALRRLWSDCADAQAELSLRRAQMQSCKKCCGPAQISSFPFISLVHVSNTKKAAKIIFLARVQKDWFFDRAVRKYAFYIVKSFEQLSDQSLNSNGTCSFYKTFFFT